MTLEKKLFLNKLGRWKTLSVRKGALWYTVNPEAAIELNMLIKENTLLSDVPFCHGKFGYTDKKI